MIKMLTWNDPYVLSVILGLVAIIIFHFDQKKKDPEYEIDKVAYTKVFILVAGAVMLFNYFVEPMTSAITTATENTTEVVKVPSVINTPSPPTNLIKSPTSAFVPISGLGELKIKEGPPNF
jgi:hypothetical protein